MRQISLSMRICGLRTIPISLGNYELGVIHTPGYTSGCICIYELTQRLLFPVIRYLTEKPLSEIATSGNISEYIDFVECLSTLRIAELCPCHGRVSSTTEQDMKQVVVYATDTDGRFKGAV